ncbi:lysine--tRNA ligase [Patescibacteria group bacterium]|nr:MAG: lysine--tRNA ligase [Patescibacteria group bacterium]
MAKLGELRKVRLEKLSELKKAGVNPYPSKVKRTYTSKQAEEFFDELVKKKKVITLAGRLMSLREHGGLTFANLRDESGKFQLAFKKNTLGENYKLLKKLDIGDFVEASGKCFKTKLGQKTLNVSKFALISKSLRPLPEKWHGLKDQELRYRKRYLDLIMNEKAKQVFHLRSVLIDSLRDFLTDKNFLEVETPILQQTFGGAVAKPFTTHHNALDTDFYLRIAPELYLKRLIVGGFEKVFEIGRIFRNEGISTIHNPDFTMLEFYWAYADYEKLMELTEKMFKHLLKRLKIPGKIEYQGHKINFKAPWQKVTFKELLQDKVGLDITKVKKRDELAGFAKDLGVKIDPEMGLDKIVDEIFKKKVRAKIAGPLFITNYPLFLSPLAKKRAEDSKEVERYQLILGGFEIVNAYSELNDPLDQRERFEEQLKMRQKGDQEAHPLDEDYLEAMEYGMPPTAGFGLGVDRLTMILSGTDTIRDVILFPVLKPKNSKKR